MLAIKVLKSLTKISKHFYLTSPALPALKYHLSIIGGRIEAKRGAEQIVDVHIRCWEQRHMMPKGRTISDEGRTHR